MKKLLFDDQIAAGNCQTSNKTKGSVGRLGLLFYLLFVGEHSPVT